MIVACLPESKAAACFIGPENRIPVCRPVPLVLAALEVEAIELQRMVEIGMRKILGAKRENLVRQFWSESSLIVSIAMGLGLTAAILLLPLFNRLASKNIVEPDILTLPNLVLFAAFAAALGILAGVYPGDVLSRIHPAGKFRGNLKLGGKTVLTRLLVMVQFSLSVFLVLATLVLSKQLKYIHSMDLGYEREGVVVIKTFERDYDLNHQLFAIFRDEAEGLPHILEISGCVFPLSSEIGSGKLTYNEKRLDFNFTSVHYNFFDTMGIKFIAGGDFPPQHPPDHEPLIVTESFVRAFEIENPVGTMIDEGTQIVGVVEDIHFWNLKQEIKPTIMMLDRRTGPRNLLVRVDTSDVGRAMRLTKALEFGTVWVNDHIPIISEMPHGGFKNSGYGKDMSMYALEAYTEVKHVMIKH